ncbi:MAG TPA: 30S ribosomal protein S1 [Chloroflexia bacterium]|nr:30S ribosomal protein S1 [Chloroflexia bacterium]
MNVTPVTNNTANNNDALANNEETQAVQGEGTVNAEATDNSTVATTAPEATNTPVATEEASAVPTETTNEAASASQEAATEAAPQASAEPQAGEAAQPTEDEEGATESLMERLLNENEAASRVRKLEYGQAIEGILMYKDRDDLLVDIGTKSEGIVPQRERQSLTPERMSDLKVGDRILVVVVRPDSGPDGDDGPILSIDKARTEVSWRKLQQQFEAGEVFEVDVVGYNKGGLMVEVEGVRGFIPASQVNALSGVGESEENRQSQMSKLVNTKLLVKIVEVNRDRNRLILSERQAVREQREASKGRLMQELEVGQIREGVVTTLAKFGAFIDLGGVDGLVHVSELSWARIDDPKQVLQVGQPVKVYILGIDQDKQKVALSIKRTQPEPWSQVTEKYQVGEVVEATISQLSNFGAFARLEEGLEGLIHISELAEGRVERPSDIVKAGDKVKVRILRIDPENRRLALSLKRAQENAEAPAEEEEAGE